MFTLGWQPSYDWPQILRFLTARAVEGVETVGKLGYVKSLSIGGHHGLVHVIPDLHVNVLHATLGTGLRPIAPECLAKIMRLFDLGYYPQQVIAALDSLGAAHSGPRLPGCVDTFERGVRVILGQLISVLMIAKLAARVAHTYGEALEDAPRCVCFPTPEALANASPLYLKALGIPFKCAGALIYLARTILEGALVITAPTDTERGVKQLQTFPGVGHRTINYFTLCDWQTKDVLLPGNYLIKQRFPDMTPTRIQRYVGH